MAHHAMPWAGVRPLGGFDGSSARCGKLSSGPDASDPVRRDPRPETFRAVAFVLRQEPFPK